MEIWNKQASAHFWIQDDDVDDDDAAADDDDVDGEDDDYADDDGGESLAQTSHSSSLVLFKGEDLQRQMVNHSNSIFYSVLTTELNCFLTTVAFLAKQVHLKVVRLKSHLNRSLLIPYHGSFGGVQVGIFVGKTGSV